MKTEYSVETQLPGQSSEWFGGVKFTNKRIARKNMKRYRKNHDDDKDETRRVKLRLKKTTTEILEEM